jgi:CRISPR-associated protein Cmr4
MSKGLVFVQTISSLHIGSGTGIGVIDMPVQRERHTGYPIIPSSSFKGVLGSKFIGSADKKDEIFGKEDSAGQTCFLDAKILFYPVRSLKGSFLLVTSKETLERFVRDIEVIGTHITLPAGLDVDEGDIITNSVRERTEDSAVILEEFSFSVQNMQLEVAQFFSDLFPSVKEFAILNQTDFSYFARNASEVYARIALDAEKKVAKDKALFYQEFVPAESIFYSMILDNASKSEPSDSFDLRTIVPKYLQLGGNETIGKGICKTYIDKLSN